jgi:hypothetical protein
MLCHPENAAHLPDVSVEFMPPNMTSTVQPMEQEVIRVLKYHFRHFQKWFFGRML